MIRSVKRFRKRSTRVSPKQIAHSNRDLSVTVPHVVTDKRKDPPSRRYAALAPWLWLANLALRRADGRLLPPEVARHDGTALEELWDRVEAEREIRACGALTELFRIVSVQNVHRSFQQKFEWLCDLTYGVADALESCVKREGAFVNTVGSVARIDIERGQATIAISDPYRDFLTALTGTQIDRLRRCPVCERLFYAVRVTQKACSEKCNQTRRVRKWRRKQSEYEYSRKLRLAGLKPGRRAKKQ